jgi:sulfite exporter TauE/SafE
MAKQQNKTKKNMLFGKRNYKFMFIGLLLIALGFILMSGGGSDNPEKWNEDIFNFRRIRLAPMLILLGMAVEIYAIMTKSDRNDD